jgi:exosome complex RNA-binding protein Csl4
MKKCKKCKAQMVYFSEHDEYVCTVCDNITKE